MKCRLAWAALLATVVAHAQAPLEATGGKLTVHTSTIELHFDHSAVVSFKNLLTGEEYVERAGPDWFEVLRTQPSPAALVPGDWVSGQDSDGTPTATLTLTGPDRSASLTVSVVQDEISLKFSGQSNDPGLISLTWGILGLNLDPGRLVIPGQAGTYFDAVSTPDSVGLDYPVHWENQMVIYEGGKGSFLMYSPDSTPHYQRLEASRQTGALDFAVEMFAQGPFDDAQQVDQREWRIAGFSGDWHAPAARYKEIMNQIWPPVAPTGDRAWIRKVRGVVAFLTSDTSLLDKVAQEVDPTRTLIHYVDWRKDGFDINYPDYTPSDAAVKFVRHAHDLGFHVMLHANVLGISEVSPDYDSMQRFQLRSADTRKQIGWLWDEFPPGSPQRVAYISPAASEFRQLLIERLRPAIDTLKPDAIHLDAGGALINDGNGLVEGQNTMQGMIQLQKDLIQAFPSIVWGGESTNEIIGPFNWLAQRWPADSPPHPIGNYLMGDQLLFYGFLDQPDPDDARYHDYLRRYEGQGVIPLASIVSAADLGSDRKHMYDLLHMFRRWEAKQYKPDWDTDWDGDLFRFRSEDGNSAVRIETSGNIVRLEEDDNTIYQRLRNVNRIETPYFIDGWPAYDGTRLLGLDPAMQYWLTNNAYRPSAALHLTEVPENYKLGTGTFVNSRYGYVELAPVEQNWFDFISNFASAKTGTLYNGKDYPMLNRALVTVGRVAVGGDGRNGALIEIPPSVFNVNGATWVEYSVQVPVYTHVQLSFVAGIADSSGVSDGALFGVQVNGTTLYRETIKPGKWQPGSVDLTPYAGTTVRLRFLTNAGANRNPSFDIACWSDLRLDVDAAIPEAQLEFGLPDNAKVAGLSDGANNDPPSNGKVAVRTALPAKFAVFLADPPVISTGQSLISFPYDVWAQTDSGMPYPFVVESSGSIEEAQSGGVTEPETLVAVPPRNGSTLITFVVRLPNDAHTLSINYGLTDPDANASPDFAYSGVQFSLQINGEDIFTDEVRTAGWRTKQVSLDDFAGKRVLIQLKTNAEQNSLYDWARWSGLTVQ